MANNPQLVMRCDACGTALHVFHIPEELTRCPKCGSRFIDFFWLDAEPEGQADESFYVPVRRVGRAAS